MSEPTKEMVHAIREEIVRQYRDDERQKWPGGVRMYEEEISPLKIAEVALAASRVRSGEEGDALEQIRRIPESKEAGPRCKHDKFEIEQAGCAACLAIARDGLAQACAELERRVQADYSASIIHDLQTEIAALRASPSTTQAMRADVIEECAKIVEQPTVIGRGVWADVEINKLLLRRAAVIRALAQPDPSKGAE